MILSEYFLILENGFWVLCIMIVKAPRQNDDVLSSIPAIRKCFDFSSFHAFFMTSFAF